MGWEWRRSLRLQPNAVLNGAPVHAQLFMFSLQAYRLYQDFDEPAAGRYKGLCPGCLGVQDFQVL